ncbi:DUF3786 domain-containing protein [Desulforhopalus singaporensis]|nr:DUF3786 domain-containing protein [Desulforhopalus singaporensis]
MEQIRSMDFIAKCGPLGAEQDGEGLLIKLYDDVYRVDAQRISALDGREVVPAVKVMICMYVLTCPAPLPQLDENLATFREFQNSAPLVSYFTNNTNKTLESHFSGNIHGLKKRSMNIGGELLESKTHDVSLRFYAFPRIPVLLNFNDRDELFPASCSILYHKSAALFLDMECLAMTATLLSGKLLGQPQQEL